MTGHDDPVLITFSSYTSALGEKVLCYTVHCESEAQRRHYVKSTKGFPVADAFRPGFTPGLARGEAFDAPEGSVSIDRTTGDLSVVNRGGLRFTVHASDDGFSVSHQPPNCDGHSGYAEATTGEMLAQAQHIAAEDDEGCTSAVCAMTRGAGD